MTITKITKRSLVGYANDVVAELIAIEKRFGIKEFDTIFKSPGRKIATDSKVTIISFIKGKRKVHKFDKQSRLYKLQTDEIALKLHQLGGKTYLTLVDTFS